MIPLSYADQIVEGAEACRRNVVFMALSADSRPHFTTIASFVSQLEHEIVSLFGDGLLYASELDHAATYQRTKLRTARC